MALALIFLVAWCSYSPSQFWRGLCSDAPKASATATPTAYPTVPVPRMLEDGE